MPNIDDSIQLLQRYTTGGTSFSYSGLSGIEDSRSHKSQLWLLYRYPNVAGGTPVENLAWDNWYDPYVIPLDKITVDHSIKTVTIGDLSDVSLTDAGGITHTMPALAFGAGEVLEIRRSQDVDNKVAEFGAGSRVTSEALNNSVSQTFMSTQELTERVSKLEGGHFEVAVNIGGGGGGGVTSGNKGDITVAGPSSDVWTVNAGVIGSGKLEASLASDIASHVTEAEAEAAAPVQSITGAGSTTISEPTPGNFVVTSTGNSGTGSGDLENTITVTNPLSPEQSLNQVYAVGTPIETIVRDMLTAYLAPSISNITSPNPGTLTHGTAISFNQVTYNLSNPTSIASTPGSVIFSDGVTGGSTTNSINFTSATTQSTLLSVNTTGLVTSASPAGQSGSAKQNTGYAIRVEGENTQGSSFGRTENYTIRYRTYFGTTAISFNGTNGSSVIAGLSGANSSNSYRTVTVGSIGSTDWTVFAMPTCHAEDVNQIIYNGAVDVFGAFNNLGTDIVNGVEYTFFQSTIQNAHNQGDTLEVKGR